MDLLRWISILAASAATLAGCVAAPASAGVLPCTKHRGEINRTGGSAIWVAGGALHGCVAGYRGEPSFDAPPSRPRALGPWTPGSRAVFDGEEVVWAHRSRAADGTPVDAMWAADVRTGERWMHDLRPVPRDAAPLTPGDRDPGDETVVALRLGANFAAWVTGSGALLAAAQGGFSSTDPIDDDLSLIGAGTAAAGLTSSLAPIRRRLLIGRWPDAADTLGGTLRLSKLSDADDQNEECIGAHRWRVTVRPLAGEARVGAIWRASYFPTTPYCT